MSALVDWFDSLSTGVQWALVCGVAFGLMLLGIVLSLVWPVKDESGWTSEEVRAVKPAPAPEPVAAPAVPVSGRPYLSEYERILAEAGKAGDF